MRSGREGGGEGGSGALLNTHIEIVPVAAPPDVKHLDRRRGGGGAFRRISLDTAAAAAAAVAGVAGGSGRAVAHGGVFSGAESRRRYRVYMEAPRFRSVYLCVAVHRLYVLPYPS